MYVIRLTKGQTQNIILTLTEKQIITSPNYLFVFENRSTNTEVKFVKINNTDVSQYKERYNEFSIVVNSHFNTSLNGQYTYTIYEQTSTTNLNPTGLNLLESGIMELSGTTISFTEYETTSTFTIRQ